MKCQREQQHNGGKSQIGHATQTKEDIRSRENSAGDPEDDCHNGRGQGDVFENFYCDLLVENNRFNVVYTQIILSETLFLLLRSRWRSYPVRRQG